MSSIFGDLYTSSLWLNYWPSFTLAMIDHDATNQLGLGWLGTILVILFTTLQTSTAPRLKKIKSYKPPWINHSPSIHHHHMVHHHCWPVHLPRRLKRLAGTSVGWRGRYPVGGTLFRRKGLKRLVNWMMTGGPFLWETPRWLVDGLMNWWIEVCLIDFMVYEWASDSNGWYWFIDCWVVRMVPSNSDDDWLIYITRYIIGRWIMMLDWYHWHIERKKDR